MAVITVIAAFVMPDGYGWQSESHFHPQTRSRRNVGRRGNIKSHIHSWPILHITSGAIGIARSVYLGGGVRAVCAGDLATAIHLSQMDPIGLLECEWS